MRLVLDQGLPRDAASGLRGLGHERLHVGEIGMSRAADDEILALSSKVNGVVVTLDADFHTILAVSGATGPSVIRLRLQGLGSAEIVEVVQRAVTAFEVDLMNGCLLTVKTQKTTCHRLPVGSSES